MFGIVKRVQSCVKPGLHVVSTGISRLTKPLAHSRVFDTVTELDFIHLRRAAKQAKLWS